MNKLIRIILFFIVCIQSNVFAENSVHSKKNDDSVVHVSKCPDGFCYNTATGESPDVIDLRETEVLMQNILKNGSYKEIWSAFHLHSDTKRPERLKVPLLKAAHFDLRLDPQKGLLHFEKPGFRQTFEIAMPLSKEEFCPKYDVRVIDASTTHAVIQKACQRHEFRPNRFSIGTETFLYDMKTATLNFLWTDESGEKEGPYPQPEPDPRIKKIKDGYRLMWTLYSPAYQKKFKINNKYTPAVDPATKIPYLECVNLDTPEEKDSGTCGMGALRAVKQ